MDHELWPLHFANMRVDFIDYRLFYLKGFDIFKNPIVQESAVLP